MLQFTKSIKTTDISFAKSITQNIGTIIHCMKAKTLVSETFRPSV